MARASKSTEGDEPLSQQSLKSAIWYTVAKIATEEEISLPFAASEQFVASIAEVVFRQAQSLGKDLERFAKHAGRMTVNVDDVKLAVRRNEPLYDQLCTSASQHGLALADLKADQSKPKKAPRATSVAKTAASGSGTTTAASKKLTTANGKGTAASKSTSTSTAKGKEKAREVSDDEEEDGDGGGGFVKASALKPTKSKASSSSSEKKKGVVDSEIEDEDLDADDDDVVDSSEDDGKKRKRATDGGKKKKKRKVVEDSD